MAAAAALSSGDAIVAEPLLIFLPLFDVVVVTFFLALFGGMSSMLSSSTTTTLLPSFSRSSCALRSLILSPMFSAVFSSMRLLGLPCLMAYCSLAGGGARTCSSWEPLPLMSGAAEDEAVALTSTVCDVDLKPALLLLLLPDEIA